MHRRAITLERVRSITMLLLVAMIAVAGAVVVDQVVRWPWVVRSVLLLGGLVASVHLVRRSIMQTWFQAPSLQSVAVRLEQVEPSLRGQLASAIDFQRAGVDASNELARTVIEQAEQAWDRAKPARHLRLTRAAWPSTLCALMLCVWAAAIVWQPQTSMIGLRRTLTPWSGDQWPARVAIEVTPIAESIARGVSVPLQVRVVRGDDASLQVRVRCIITGSNGQVSERELDLVRQADGVYERPIMAEGDRMRIEFAARDADTQAFTLGVVTPPSIERCALTVQPPTYATGDQPAVDVSWQATSPPEIGNVLAGSRVALRLDLAAPAPVQRDTSGALDAPWLQRVVQLRDAAGALIGATTIDSGDARHWNITWTAHVPMDVVVQPMDAQGVQAPDALRFALRVIPDREPTVSVTEPESDETITPQATIPFTIDASDDLRLSTLGWTVDRQQRSGEPGPVRLGATDRPATEREMSLKDTLNIPSMQVRGGDVLLLRGVAQDRCEQDGVARKPTRSDPRQLRVVDRETFERQMRQQTNTLRQAVARLEASQQDIERNPDAAAAARAQAGLTDRVRQTDAAASKLVQRLVRNELKDIALTETLNEAARLGQQAESQSTQAQDALQRAASGDQQAAAKARTHQQQAQQSLRDMVDLLDRDDDAAGAQRRADRLAESITKLRNDLREASRSSAGKSSDELTATEKQAMQEQASRQRTAADEARAMLDDLRARAEKNQSKDRAQARSLQQAAEEGEKGQVSRRMDEAADRTDRNQATAADESMQAAAEAVERVREALREDRRARTEDLRRRLASLDEALQSLIKAGESATQSMEGLDAAAKSRAETVATECIRIARNSAAASQQAQEAGNTTRPIAKVIDRATERFEEAVRALRGEPITPADAQQAARRGTDLFRDALKQVKDLQKKEAAKSQERERANLSKTYQELATQVRSVRDATVKTIPQTGERMDRRSTATQREQAARLQGTLQAFQTGPKASELVVAAETFKAAHARIDKDLSDSVTSLQGATADARTIRRLDMAADTLMSLAIALRDPEQGEDPFADGKNDAQQEGGGSGGSDAEKKGLPPIAELRLVRQLQAQVNQLTKTLDQSRASGQPVDAELTELGAMQDEVRRLGEDWIRRMNERTKGGDGKKPVEAPTITPTDAYFFPWRPGDEATPPAKTDAPKAPTAPPAKTLDELLGIDGPSSGDAAAQAQRDRKLEKSLKEEDLKDLAKNATESMELATTLVGQKRDAGIGTQRVQADALASLDALIDAATKFQKQQQSKGSSSGSSSSKQKQQQQGEGQQQSGKPEEAGKPEQAAGQKPKQAGERSKDGTQGDQVEPPPPEDASVAASGVLQEGRSEWGRLPQRIREIMSQARRDRISAIYQQATEAYYRRMAEDKSP